MFVVMNIYVFKEIRSHIERLETNIDELEREIEKGRAAKADLPRLEEDIRNYEINYEIELERLRRILPTKRETDNLIKRAKQLTERGRFRLTRFTPGNFEDRDFFIEWPIRVGLDGTWVGLDGTFHELGLFFDRLSRFSRIINVTELTISPLRSSTGDYTIKADFVQRTYIFKEETPPTETQP
jgi:type IV pilus assembly protein PilO